MHTSLVIGMEVGKGAVLSHVTHDHQGLSFVLCSGQPWLGQEQDPHPAEVIPQAAMTHVCIVTSKIILCLLGLCEVKKNKNCCVCQTTSARQTLTVVYPPCLETHAKNELM